MYTLCVRVCTRARVVILPRTPVFQTVLVYLRPETMLFETVKHNLRRYRLPSLRVKRLLFELVVVNGNGNTRSDRPGHEMERFNIFTSGSLLSDFNKKIRLLFRF